MWVYVCVSVCCSDRQLMTESWRLSQMSHAPHSHWRRLFIFLKHVRSVEHTQQRLFLSTPRPWTAQAQTHTHTNLFSTVRPHQTTAHFIRNICLLMPRISQSQSSYYVRSEIRDTTKKHEHIIGWIFEYSGSWISYGLQYAFVLTSCEVNEIIRETKSSTNSISEPLMTEYSRWFPT